MQSEQNKITLVTGANTGVGFQIAKALIANNYIVLIGARNLAKGKDAALQFGKNAIAIELDVTKQNTITAATEEIQQKYANGIC